MRDAIFDPSEVFYHCAQLIDTLRMKGINPTVLVLQTDGDPDHSLKRTAVQLALLAIFKELDVDHLVMLWCAPNGLVRNKVECSISVINLALAHVSVERGEMEELADGEVKNCSSMKSVHDLVRKIEEHRFIAFEEIPALNNQLKHAVIVDLVTSGVEKVMEDARPNDKQPQMACTSNASSISKKILQYLCI